MNINLSTDLTSDAVDQSQNAVQNTRGASYAIPGYVFHENILSPSYIDFESQNLTVITGNPIGPGISPDVIDINSELTMKYIVERPLQRLDLHPRPYITVPYLGRGSCDVDVESKLMQGEYFFDKKSVNTIMESSFTEYSSLLPVGGADPRQIVIEDFPVIGASSRTMTTTTTSGGGH